MGDKEINTTELLIEHLEIIITNLKNGWTLNSYSIKEDSNYRDLAPILTEKEYEINISISPNRKNKQGD